MSARRLVSTRREIAGELLERYDLAWQALERTATEAGAHAWRFVSAADPTRFLEFLEFRKDEDLRESPVIRRALADLERLAPGVSETWDERHG